MAKRRDRRIMTKKPRFPNRPILSVGEIEGQKVLGVELTREMVKELFQQRWDPRLAMIPLEFLDVVVPSKAKGDSQVLFVTLLKSNQPLTEAQLDAVKRRLQTRIDEIQAILNKAAQK